MQVTSTSFRAYALDLWGFGDTAHNDSKYGLKEQAELVHAFLNELGIGKIAIVGHGLGALVGMKFATLFKDNVDRVMAVNCPIEFRGIDSRLWRASPQELSDWLSNGSAEAATALSDASKAQTAAISGSRKEIEEDKLFNEYRNLGIPCLLVYGEKDQVIAPPTYEAATSTFTHQIVLDGLGHFPMIEETIKFNRLLTDFLALPSGISPSELQMKDEWKRRVR